MTIARTNHYAAPPDCTTLDRTRRSDPSAFDFLESLLEPRVPAVREKKKIGRTAALRFAV